MLYYFLLVAIDNSNAIFPLVSLMDRYLNINKRNSVDKESILQPVARLRRNENIVNMMMAISWLFRVWFYFNRN